MVSQPVPAKPVWYSKIGDVIRELQSLPRPFVDRATVEFLLGVGRRRAQQIMAPCITHRGGANGLADRDAFIAHLRNLAEGDGGFYEQRRRRKVGEILSQLQKERLERPQLLVEAQVQILTQEFEDLPAGVRLEPGRITITFDRPQQALEKLLALAMAVGNDFDRFDRQVRSVHESFEKIAALGLALADTAVTQLFGPGLFLRWWQRHEFSVQQQVINDLQPSGHKKWKVDQ